jgi:hypothetical protein
MRLKAGLTFRPVRYRDQGELKYTRESGGRMILRRNGTEFGNSNW